MRSSPTRFEDYLGWIQPHHAFSDPPRPAGLPRPARGRASPAIRTAGIFCHPTIVDGVREDDAIFLNETFGPLVGVTTYRDLDEAIRLANVPGYGLSSSIYTSRARRGVRVPRGASRPEW